MYTLTDRTVVITGAASGIGRDLALTLAGRGCHLALVDIDAEGLAETVAQARRVGLRISLHRADVAQREQMERLPGEVLEQHTGVDVLVNNAGVALAGPLENCQPDDLDWILDINLRGTLYGCRFFLPHLRRSSGAIVNISSDFGMLGLPGKSAYCATKFGVRGLSEALRAELWAKGVAVICVYPGAVDTGIVRNSRAVDPRKREIEARFVAERGLPIRRVSEKIARGIERRQARVLIGTETVLMDWAARWFPGLTAALIRRYHRRLPFL